MKSQNGPKEKKRSKKPAAAASILEAHVSADDRKKYGIVTKSITVEVSLFGRTRDRVRALLPHCLWMMPQHVLRIMCRTHSAGLVCIRSLNSRRQASLI